MPSDTQTKPMTAADLLALPDDEFRYELIRGELRKMAPTGGRHGMIAVDIATALNQHVKANELGRVFAAETGFLLASDPDTVRAPDAAFVRRERIEEIGSMEGYWPGAPDLAVEVVSPNDPYTEVEEKVIEWLEAGTRMVIVVNPRQEAATVYRSRHDIAVLTEEDTLDGGDVVPGWSLPVQELFT
jgi:Uma2 family endonuclease